MLANGLLEVSIRFPNLGLEFKNVGKGISVFGFEIAYYGIIIAIGMALGYGLAQWQATRTKQNNEIYLDFAMIAIIAAIVGARAYYVTFTWDEYKNNPIEILNIRGGGLAIYGGIIAAVIAAIIFSKVKKISFWLLTDTACAGLALGQSIGRWGNFFNREAFGSYTNGLFAMQLRLDEVSASAVNNDPKYLKNLKVIDGIEYIQVHPTFLYESIINFIIAIVIVIFIKKKQYDGQMFLIYLAVYGTARGFLEGLRTDQLLLWNTNLAVSQLLSFVVAGCSLIVLVVKAFIVVKTKKENVKEDE
jgi:phosphatidylglycerol:prolipoprotein diacylglycerol transferase